MSFFKPETLYPFNGDFNKLPYFREITEEFNGPIIRDDDKGKHFTYLESDRKHYRNAPEDYPDHLEPLYITNKLGFRAEDNYDKADGPNAIMFAGDSFTYGIGSRQHEMFAHYISSDLGAVNWNVGAAGQGNEVIALMVNHFLLAGYIPKKLVVTWSYRDRKLMFDKPVFGVGKPEDLNAITYIPGTFYKHLHNIKTAFKAWIALTSNQSYFMFWTYRNMLLEVCKKHNVEVVEGFLDPNLFEFVEKTVKPEKYIKTCLRRNFEGIPVNGTKIIGRCGQHWGADANRKVADLYLELLSDRRSL